MPTTISFSGPLFDGAALPIIGRFSEAAKQKVAQEGVDMVRRRLSGVIRHEVTGRAVSAVMTDTQANDIAIVDNVVYNTWLEGTSSRNVTTRFKGYQTFRLTSDELNRASGEIAARVLVEGGYLEELGGK